MEQAVAQVERLRNFFREHPVSGEGESGEVSPSQQRGGSSRPPRTPDVEAFRDALADDFNTPRAMAEVFELVGEANRGEVAGRGGDGAARDARAARPRVARRSRRTGADAEAQELMAEREEARAAKDFERADEIRDELAELGWEVRDSAEGAAPGAEGG